MINKELRDKIKERGFEDALLFEKPGFDNSIIGTTTYGNVVYDFTKMINEYMSEENSTYEKAKDFIERNTIQSLDFIDNFSKPIIILPF